MLEISLVLTFVAVVAFTYLVGYCKGRIDEMRARTPRMQLHRLDAEEHSDMQQW
jgi:hypothetical protein